VGADDTYLIADLTQGQGAAAMIWGGAMTPTETAWFPGEFDPEGGGTRGAEASLSHHLVIPAGATRALLMFTISARPDAGDIASRVQALLDLSDPAALAGLSADEKNAIANFTVPQQTVVSGIVADAAGQPLEGATVRARRQGVILGAVVTNNLGSYELSLSTPDTYDVEALDSQGVPVARRSIVAPATGADLTVPLRGTVNVTLARDASSPLFDVNVTIQSDNPNATPEDAQRHRTGAAPGTVSSVAPVGNIIVSVTDASGAHTATGALTADSTLDLTIDLPLPAGDKGELKVTVFDGQTTKVPNALVRVVPTNGQPALEKNADNLGVAQFAALDPGNYEVYASIPALNRPGHIPVFIRAQETAQEEIHLMPADQTGTLIIDADLEQPGHPPAAGAVVDILDDGILPPWSTTVVLNAAGHAMVPGLPAGTLGITTEVPYGRGWSDGRIEPGQTTHVRFRIGDREWLPLDFTGSDGLPRFLFNSGETATSTDSPYSCDPFCGTFGSVNDEDFPGMAVAHKFQDRAEGEIGPRTMSGLTVTRRAFVPAQGGFVRYLEVIHNPTSQELAVEYGLGLVQDGIDWVVESTGSTATTATDASYTASDDYVITSRAGHRLVVVTSAANGTQRNTSVSFVHDDSSSQTALGPIWNALTVAPGETVILMQFVAEAWDLDAAKQKAESLAKLTDPDALAGMSPEEKQQIVNFQVAH
jgi:hypothetical protein